MGAADRPRARYIKARATRLKGLNCIRCGTVTGKENLNDGGDAPQTASLLDNAAASRRSPTRSMHERDGRATLPAPGLPIASRSRRLPRCRARRTRHAGRIEDRQYRRRRRRGGRRCRIVGASPTRSPRSATSSPRRLRHRRWTATTLRVRRTGPLRGPAAQSRPIPVSPRGEYAAQSWPRAAQPRATSV